MTCQAGVDILRFLSPNVNAMVKMHFHYHHVDLMTNELFVNVTGGVSRYVTQDSI